MKIKSMIAGLLAGVLMMGNLSAVCFAAEGAPAPTDGAAETEAVETVPAGADGTDEGGDASETDAPALPDGVTLGTKVVLPEGVTISEDGKITFSAQGMEQIMEALMGADTGKDTDTDTDADAEPEAETVTVGTVNVRSDTYLNLRSGSGMEHSVIGHLLRGTEVEVIGESGDWYEVVVPEATGYVYKDYLDVAEQEAPAAPPAEEGQDAPDTSGGFDEDTLMMMLLLMMSMGNMDTDASEPPSAALTPDGNLTLVDDYRTDNADGSGKQFITLVTKAGNTFYLVIDRDDEGEQTVHFMNLVDERDLLSLMGEDEAAEYTKPEPEVQPPAETQEPDGGDEPDEPEPPAKANPLPALLLVVALLGGGGFFAYTKFFKGGGKKEQVKPDPDADYSEDEEDYGLPDDLGLDDEDGEDFDGPDDEPV